MEALAPRQVDRLEIRSRPAGSPLMHQRWEKLLFLHWPVAPASIERILPRRLTIDTFEGQAWIGITPFALTGLRPTSLPAIPGLSSFLELNVRTYVHYDGVPGVWFFSLYASRTLPVLGARALFSLPYRVADMEMRDSGERMHYFLRRNGRHGADFEASWAPGPDLPSPSLDSLEFFLAERYALYAAQEDRLYRCRVYHVPWCLRQATLLGCRSTLIAAEGLVEPVGPPLVHYGGDQAVDVWPLEEV